MNDENGTLTNVISRTVFAGLYIAEWLFVRESYNGSQNKTGGYKRKKWCSETKVEVKKPCGLHVRELSAEGVQGGGENNVRWEVVPNVDGGG